MISLSEVFSRDSPSGWAWLCLSYHFSWGCKQTILWTWMRYHVLLRMFLQLTCRSSLVTYLWSKQSVLVLNILWNTLIPWHVLIRGFIKLKFTLVIFWSSYFWEFRVWNHSTIIMQYGNFSIWLRAEVLAVDVVILLNVWQITWSVSDLIMILWKWFLRWSVCQNYILYIWLGSTIIAESILERFVLNDSSRFNIIIVLSHEVSVAHTSIVQKCTIQ